MKKKPKIIIFSVCLLLLLALMAWYFQQLFFTVGYEIAYEIAPSHTLLLKIVKRISALEDYQA